MYILQLVLRNKNIIKGIVYNHLKLWLREKIGGMVFVLQRDSILERNTMKCYF